MPYTFLVQDHLNREVYTLPVLLNSGDDEHIAIIMARLARDWTSKQEADGSFIGSIIDHRLELVNIDGTPVLVVIATEIEHVIEPTAFADGGVFAEHADSFVEMTRETIKGDPVRERIIKRATEIAHLHKKSARDSFIQAVREVAEEVKDENKILHVALMAMLHHLELASGELSEDSDDELQRQFRDLKIPEGVTKH